VISVSPRGRLGAAVAAGCAWLALVIAWLVIRPGGAHGLMVFADTAYLVPIAAATALSVLAAVRLPRGQRLFWVLLAISNTFWLVGKAGWSVHELISGAGSTPWWNNVGHLASSAVLPIAIVVAFRPTLRTVGITGALDATLVVGALVLLWWTIVLEPLALGPDLTSVVGIAYPALGLLLVGMLTGVAVLPARRWAPAVALVSAAVAVGALTDGVYSRAVLTDTHFSGAWVGLGWQVEAVLLSVAAVAALGPWAQWTCRRRPSALPEAAAAGLSLAVLVIVLAVAGAENDVTWTILAVAGTLAAVIGARFWLLAKASSRRGRLVDAETGMVQPEYFHDQLDRSVARARTFGDSFAVALVELDGRPDGGEEEAARRIAGAARDVDVVARLEDSRFAVLIARVGKEDALATAERLRAAISGEPFRVRQGVVAVLTASVGVATCGTVTTAADLLADAETALAEARSHGGNQVCVHPPDSSFDRLLEIARAVDAREGSDEAQSRRVAELSALLAGTLGLGQEAERRVYLAGLLHDLGEVALPDWLLSKPGPLEPCEWEEVQRHPLLGADLLGRLDAVKEAAPIVAAHHERWDGSGYPHRVAGDEIPAEARVLALADALVAMTSDRPYRRALTLTAALTEIWRLSNRSYDPDVVAALFALVREGRLDLDRDRDRDRPRDASPAAS
jgi:two-component system cell cycle response regulator